MSETFACRLTASIAGAIATIAIRGPNCLPILGRCLNQALPESQLTIGRIRFVKWPIGDAEEHVVACRVDEQTLEVHCHGGVAVSNAILEALRLQGCRIVDQSGWTDAALGMTSTGPGDRLKSMCNQALIQTTSERAAGILLDQANGAIFAYFEKLDQLLQTQQWTSAKALIESVSYWNKLGSRLVEPWRVVLAGPPNVGKSSLINALSGKSLAIVHHEAGTTRDWIETTTQIDGWPISLTDTAGMRQTSELIEREGVLRATQRIGQADLVVIVVDATIGWTQPHDEILELCQLSEQRPQVLIARNKCDLPHGDSQPESTKMYPTVRCSADGEISSLLEAISRSLVPESPLVGQPIVFARRYQQLQAEILARLQIPVAPDSISELQLLSYQLLFGQSSSLS